MYLLYWLYQSTFNRLFGRQISGFAVQVHSKDSLYNRFKSIRDSLKGSLTMKKEVPTKRVSMRWNSDLACAETHRDLHVPIEVMTNTKVGKYDMTEYQLSLKLWELLSEVCDCLPVSHVYICYQPNLNILMLLLYLGVPRADACLLPEGDPL